MLIIDSLQSQSKSHWLSQLKEAKLVHKIDQTYQLWQEGCHPQALLTPQMARQKIEYIHNNPVARGYVDEPSHWRYSSDRNYLGQVGLIEVELLAIE